MACPEGLALPEGWGKRWKSRYSRLRNQDGNGKKGYPKER